MISATRQRRRHPDREQMGRRHRPDYLIVIISLILMLVGLMVVYSISPSLSVQKHVSDNYFVSKQVIAILIGVVAFTTAAMLPISWWLKWQKLFIGLAILAAVAVQFFGERVNGAYRWIQIGGLSFQAVELIKFTLIIGLAAFLSSRIRTQTLDSWHKTFRPLLFVLLAIGVVVAFLESDLGSTAVLISIMGIMCFVAGLPLKRIMMIAAIVGIGLILAIASFGYRRERLNNYLHPEADCQGSGYQACQALIAVGSGGLVGKGLGRSYQGSGYLPEAANDSIFAILAEKFGFVGICFIITLYLILFSRLKNIIIRAPDDYSRLVVVGILAWLSVQTIINIGSMIGLLPLKGITLPFVSYGGTSVIFVSLIIGICFNLSHYTLLRASLNESAAPGRLDNPNPAVLVTRYK